MGCPYIKLLTCSFFYGKHYYYIFINNIFYSRFLLGKFLQVLFKFPINKFLKYQYLKFIFRMSMLDQIGFSFTGMCLASSFFDMRWFQIFSEVSCYLRPVLSFHSCLPYGIVTVKQCLIYLYIKYSLSFQWKPLFI